MGWDWGPEEYLQSHVVRILMQEILPQARIRSSTWGLLLDLVNFVASRKALQEGVVEAFEK